MSFSVFYSYITAADMAHVGRDGLMEKMKELNIATLSVEHPDVSTKHFAIIAYNTIIIGLNFTKLMHFGTRMNVSVFGIKRLKFKVTA